MQQNLTSKPFKPFKTGIYFLCTLMLLEIVIFLSNDMYIPALSTIANVFNISKAEAGQTISIWFLGSTAFQLFVGPIIDRYGHKASLTISCLNFSISSLLCAITSNPGLLMLCRFLQGASVGFILTSGYSIIHETQSSIQSVKTTSTMRSISLIAPALGPSFGAIFVKYYSWRLMFFGFAAFGLLGCILFSTNTPTLPRKLQKLEAKKILTSYFNMIFKEKNLMCYIGCISFNFMFLISWIIESVNIVKNIYGQNEYFYGLTQVLVAAAISIGGQLSGRFAKSKNLKKTITTICIGLISALCLGYLLQTLGQASLPLAASIIACGFFLSGITGGILNRLAIESSSETVSMSNTIITTFRCLAGSVAASIVAFINIQSIKTFFLLSTVYCLLSFGSFLLIKNVGWKKLPQHN